MLAAAGAMSPPPAGYLDSCGSSRRGSWMNGSGSESSCSWAIGACLFVFVLTTVCTAVRRSVRLVADNMFLVAPVSITIRSISVRRAVR